MIERSLLVEFNASYADGQSWEVLFDPILLVVTYNYNEDTFYEADQGMTDQNYLKLPHAERMKFQALRYHRIID